MAVELNPAGTILTLTGDATNDQVAVVGQSSYVDIYVGGRFQARLSDTDADTLATIDFDGDTGNDSLTVQNIQPSGSLTIVPTAVESLSVVRSQDVSVNAVNGFSFGTSSVTGDLTVVAAGSLTQSGPLVVGGTTSLAVSAGNITLTNPSNNFATVDIDADAVASNVSLRDVNSLVLAQSEIGGNLSVQASMSSSARGSLTQAGKLDVDGTTTLAVGRASTITLAHLGVDTYPDNALSGAITITSAGDATIYNSEDIALGASSVTGNLQLTADVVADPGAAPVISQTGRVLVGKTATLSATYHHGAGPVVDPENITLDNQANNFKTVVVTAGNNVTLRDVNALDLGASTVSGTLQLTTRGAITQSGTLNVAGTTTLDAGLAGNVTLIRPTNVFGGTVTITNGRNVSLRDSDGGGLDLGGPSTITGKLTVIAGGQISQSGGILDVRGKAIFAAGTAGAAAHVTLNTQDNLFSSVSVTYGDDVLLKDTAGTLVLGASRISGDLTVEAAGAITQSGSLVVAGNTSLDAGANTNDITLKTSSNNFNTLMVFNGRDVTLVDANDLELGFVGVVNPIRNLSVTVRGGITQTGLTDLHVGGTTTLSAGRASAIDLGEDNNQLTGAVSIKSAGNATLNNTLATALGLSTVTGNLTVTSGDGITQTGKITVGRTADLTANSGAGDITLIDPANNFYIVMLNGATVSLRDVNTVVLSTSTADDLTVVAGKSIAQSGAVAVTGATTLEAGPRDGITLVNDDNDFGTGPVSLIAGKNVNIHATGGIDFGASQVGGTFSVTAGDDITDSGALLIAGKTTLSTTGGVVFNHDTGGNPDNDFNEVAVTAEGATGVVLHDVDDLRLGKSEIDGTLEVVAGGPITQSGAVVVRGVTATFAADGSNITLLNSGNDFVEVILTGHHVSLNNTDLDMDGLNLGTTTVTGDLSLTTNGDLTGTGAVDVSSGTATLRADGGGNIDLGGSANNIQTLVVAAANDVSIDNGANDLALGTSDISGSLTIVTTSATETSVTQVGPITVAGTLSVDATGGNIDLSLDGNSFYVVDETFGVDVSLVNGNTEGIDLQDVTVTGNLYVWAAGDIKNSEGTLAVSTATATATFLAEDATQSNQYDIALGVGGICQISAVLVMIGKDVEVVNAVDTVLGDCTATGDFLTVTGVSLTNDLGGLAGALHVANGVTTLTAATGNLTLIRAADCVFGDWTGDIDIDDDTGEVITAADGNLVLSAPSGIVHVES